MSNPVTFAPNRDQFRGGSITQGTVPNLNGSIPAARNGGSLQEGVTAGQPMLARNNRGSNITIPYARVCIPLTQTNAIKVKGDDTEEIQVKESEALFSGRIAFILGRRSKHLPTRSVTNDQTQQKIDAFNTFGGGSDVNTMQRMCSFEYLRAYFSKTLWSRTIILKNERWENYTPSLRALQRRSNLYDNFNPLDVDVKDLVNELTGEKSYNYKSGIYIHDSGPFLRGHTLERSLLKCRNLDGKKIPAAIGDIIAFERLQDILYNIGACDWVPDGIVHSKLSQGDKHLDDELDSRDGQLFNITVGGPAVTSSWSNDKHMTVLPLDKVFVVIVADVWTHDESDKMEFPKEKDAYEKLVVDTFKNEAYDIRQEASIQTDTQCTITNMRVRLTTSSEMVNCSYHKPGFDNKPDVQYEDNLRAHFRTRTSRMGLSLGSGGKQRVSEYIIGGWCIGTVLDSAASRSVNRENDKPLVGAVKRQRTAHASNLHVDIQWWSADKMFRSFMNIEKRITTRYNDESKSSASTDPEWVPKKQLNLPASSRKGGAQRAGDHVKADFDLEMKNLSYRADALDKVQTEIAEKITKLRAAEEALLAKLEAKVAGKEDITSTDKKDAEEATQRVAQEIATLLAARQKNIEESANVKEAISKLEDKKESLNDYEAYTE